MKKLIALGVVVVVLAVGAFAAYAMLSSDDPDLATEAPQITPAAGSTATTGSSSAPASSGPQRFTIGQGSTAKFVVKEDLRGVPDVTTVGQTSAVTGDIYVSSSGLAANPKSTFKVDLSTLATDNGMRDNFIKNNTLQTNQEANKFAEFTIDSVTGFPTNYKEGDEVSLKLTGQLKIHGVTKAVTWDVKARQSGNTLTATADADIKMTDFGMTPPDVGIAKSKDDVHLQVVFTSTRAAV